MPHHPSEENAEEHVFDKVAKESDNSTASDHALHQDKSIAHAEAHKSKGPQISDNMPKAEGTKEELQAKAKELNK